MKDENKSKEQLIKKIKALQTQVAGLAKSEFRHRETENRLSAVISKSPIPTALGGADGSIILFNEALENLIGYKSEEIRSVEDWVNKLYPDKEYRDFVNKNIKQALDGQKQDCTEFTIVCKDKSVKMVDFYTSFFQGGLVIQMIDITERKKSEEDLRKSEEKYRSLFKNMTEGFAYCRIITDKNNKPVDFVYLDVNDAFERLTGLKRKDLLGKRATEAIPGIKEAHPELFDIYGKVALTGKGTQFDIYFAPLDIWLSISVDSPKKGYFVAVFDNITDRKKAENKLRESQGLLQRAEQISRIGSWELDPSTNKIIWSKEMYKIFGIKPEEFDGTLEAGINRIHPDDRMRAITISQAAIQEKRPYHVEYRLVYPDGAELHVLAKADIICNNKGEVIKVIGTVQDITERKKVEEEKEKLQQQIIQSEKMAALGEIGAGIAHELNTPLNVILGYQELMQKKIAKCPEFKEYLDISIEEVEQCRQLISDFLMYARPSGGRMLKDHSVNITEVITSILKLSSINKEKNINIKLDIEKDLPLISGDKKQIMQVFMNVLNNAIQAMPKGGNITISARHIKNGGIAKNGEIIEFRITDTGEGIPRENITKVFDPFFTSKRPGKGTGLGLAVCQRIIENHKGTIRVESESGKGTTVIGQLPVSKSSA